MQERYKRKYKEEQFFEMSNLTPDDTGYPLLFG